MSSLSSKVSLKLTEEIFLYPQKQKQTKIFKKSQRDILIDGKRQQKIWKVALNFMDLCLWKMLVIFSDFQIIYVRWVNAHFSVEFIILWIVNFITVSQEQIKRWVIENSCKKGINYYRLESTRPKFEGSRSRRDHFHWYQDYRYLSIGPPNRLFSIAAKRWRWGRFT